MDHYPRQLTDLIEEETAHFCEAEHTVQAAKGNLGKTYPEHTRHARLTNCGIATALVQHNLLKYHDIATERLFGRPPEAPRNIFGRRLGHVLLRANDLFIDPTYGQFFNYVGGDAHTSPLANYPEALALTFTDATRQETVAALTDSLEQFATTTGSQETTLAAPLRGLGRTAVERVIHDIYTIDHYEPYPVLATDISYDYVQNLIRTSDALRNQ